MYTARALQVRGFRLFFFYLATQQHFHTEFQGLLLFFHARELRDYYSLFVIYLLNSYRKCGYCVRDFSFRHKEYANEKSIKFTYQCRLKLKYVSTFVYDLQDVHSRIIKGNDYFSINERLLQQLSFPQ